MIPDEDEPIPLSALQHYVFCPRQCALIHVEQAWSEDAATAKGRLLHEKVDAGGMERRPGVGIARGIFLRSYRLGVFGKADAVEFHDGRPYPVEYKLGKPKTHRADEVQLCAQGLCLEEMFDTPVPEGALFYGQTRRRQIVAFDPELRALTGRIASETKMLLVGTVTPPPVAMPACRRCSLKDNCQPERLTKPPRIAIWLEKQIGD
jgi:CRISPR-associated exonuclease Cas4